MKKLILTGLFVLMVSMCLADGIDFNYVTYDNRDFKAMPSFSIKKSISIIDISAGLYSVDYDGITEDGAVFGIHAKPTYKYLFFDNSIKFVDLGILDDRLLYSSIFGFEWNGNGGKVYAGAGYQWNHDLDGTIFMMGFREVF